MKRFFQVILTTALCASATGISPVSAKPVTDRNQLGSVVKSMNEGRMSRMDIPFKDKKAAALTAMMNKSGLKKAPEAESVFTDTEYFSYLEARMALYGMRPENLILRQYPMKPTHRRFSKALNIPYMTPIFRK